MKLISAIILAAANLTTATPSFQAEPENKPISTSFQKRFADNHYCSDSNWKKFGERAALAGLRLLGGIDDGSFDQEARDEINDVYTVERGQCLLMWCGGSGDTSVAFYLCLKKDAENDTFQGKDLAKEFHDGFYDCNDREPKDKNEQAWAFHVWAKDYTLSVEGGPGLRCPEDMETTRFAYPTSFNEEPYI